MEANEEPGFLPPPISNKAAPLSSPCQSDVKRDQLKQKLQIRSTISLHNTKHVQVSTENHLSHQEPENLNLKEKRQSTDSITEMAEMLELSDMLQ